MAQAYAPSFAALRAFEAVGRLRGIRRAAESLGTSHAIVSRHLRGLEQQLGVTLFERAGSRLTDTGAIFHQRISRALADIAEAAKAVRPAEDAPLRIFCAQGLALHWLTARLHRFARPRSTPLMLDLQTSDTAPDFSRDEADGDIRYLPNQALSQPDPGVQRIALASPIVFPVAAPDLAGRLAERLRSARDLLHAPLIEERDEAEWTHWFAVQGLDSPPVSRVARYAHAHLALAAARAGQGVALANPFLVNDDLAAGRLVRLTPPDHSFVDARLGAYVFRSGKARWSDPAVAHFRRWLTREFEADGQDI